MSLHILEKAGLPVGLVMAFSYSYVSNRTAKDNFFSFSSKQQNEIIRFWPMGSSGQKYTKLKCHLDIWPAVRL